MVYRIKNFSEVNVVISMGHSWQICNSLHGNGKHQILCGTLSISGSNFGRRLSLIRSNQSDLLHVWHAIVPLIILRYFNLCCALNHNHDINPIIKIQFIL